MKIKFCLIFSVILCGITHNANAVYVIGDVSAWGNIPHDDSSFGDGIVGDEFMLDYKNQIDSAFIMAKKISQNGGLFVPVRMYCGWSTTRMRFTYYATPQGNNNVGAQWLCADGYYGDNCSKHVDLVPPTACTSTVNALNRSKIKCGTNEDNGDFEANLQAFVSYYSNRFDESDIILGIVRYLPHGVVAAPVVVQCTRPGYDEAKLTAYLANGGIKRILCADGYVANTTNPDSPTADCVPYSDKCAAKDLKFCDGFSFNDYDPAKHTLLADSKDSCSKFLCSGENQAFASATDKSCISCVKSFNVGMNSDNGLCIKCENNELFDSESNECKATVAYNTDDLRYGINMWTKVSRTMNQCWTFTTKEEFKKCFYGE